MKLSFNLSYKTVWGQSLHAVLYRAQAGANERKINIPLSTQDGQTWRGEIQLLLKDPLTYTGYFSEALSFSDIVDAYLYIAKHGLEKLATVIKRY